MNDWIPFLVGLLAGSLWSVFFYRLGYKIGWHDAEDDFADRASRERRGRTSGSTWYEPH
jgi:hypothetical protein